VSILSTEAPVVIVDPYSSGAQLAPALTRRNVPVVSVMTAEQPPSVYAESHRPQDFPRTIVWKGDDDEVVEQLRALAPRAVIAGCESGVELAERLAARVTPDAANDPALASARRHKGAMAAAVAAAGLPVIPQITTADRAAVEAWLQSVPAASLVVKPPRSASTDGVVRVARDEWRPAFDSMLGAVNRLGLVNSDLVVQKYVTGTEYVVDTFSLEGRHTVTDVCRYRKVLDGQSVAVYDTMEWVAPSDPAVATVVRYAREVLTAVGLRLGAAHVEIMLTDDGPLLIEVGARAHGGGQPRYCLRATGDSQVERTARYFAGRADTIPDSYVLRNQMLVVFHLCRRAGVVRDLSPLAEMERLPTVVEAVHHYRFNGEIAPTTDLFSSLDLGFVVLSGPSRADLQRDYARIRELEDDLFGAARIQEAS
jgi:biotin carboxylase